ncbi:hypothetical protein [Acetivibrio cellulolyticus]|uniref:hypothetical protein n=1 Tax=Acetivibrio cellulolyticus TaxID=35830 RepID=UPI0002481AD7|nr:hypothetical protein [Acetivibrio cellulolyticus]
MGRKRVNELKAGGKTTLYIPQDIDVKVLDYLRSQKNLSKTLIELAYIRVYNAFPFANSPFVNLEGGYYIGDKAEEGKVILKNYQESNTNNPTTEKEDIKDKSTRKKEAMKSMLDTDGLG